MHGLVASSKNTVEILPKIYYYLFKQEKGNIKIL